MTMSMTITERLSFAGVEVETRNRAEVDALFKRLGGRVVNVTDKSVDLEFPSSAAAREFVAFARANGHAFEGL